MTSDPIAVDAALFAALRRAWNRIDPVPESLIDAMVASVAGADLGREYALLTRVELEAASVRGDADALTLQFTDGSTHVLIHVTASEGGARRLDGWVDGDVEGIQLIQDGARQEITAAGGRFSLEDVAPGISRLRVLRVAATAPGRATELLTPRFEI